MLLKKKMELQEASFASQFQSIQQSLQALNNRLDKIEQRLDNMGVASGHTITVTISFSQDKSNLYKTVVVTGSATDSLGHSMNRAALYVDDKLVSEKTSSPWTWDLDTTRYSNGAHVVKVGFWCVNGGYGEKGETVTIRNATATGGASTTYTPTGGGGTSYEQLGCQIIITNETPLSGSSINEDSVTVYVTVKDSIGHPITSVTATDAHGTRNATNVGGDRWCLGTFHFDVVYMPNKMYLPLIIKVDAACAAWNSAIPRILSYTRGSGGESWAGGRQPV